MATGERDESKVGPSRWPGQWIRQESFWREIAANTIAGLSTAFVAFLVAIGLGYLKRPNVYHFIAVLGIFCFGLAVFTFAGMALVRLSRAIEALRHHRRDEAKLYFRRTLRFAAMSAVAYACGLMWGTAFDLWGKSVDELFR